MGKYPRLLLRTCIWLLLFCLPVSASGTDKVTLQLIWKNQFQFAGYYVAKELGFYEDAGLDVTIKEYEFGLDVTADVVSQTAHFGVGRSSLILERIEGQPVFLLSAIFQHSPFMLLANKRGDLKEVADLKGKRIMVTDDVVGMASLTAMLTANGIWPGDYTSQKHTFTVDDLISGNTDAIAAYTSNETYHMQKQGVDYTIFAPKDHGFDFYSDILFTSQKLYQDKPQLVARFHQASLRGWEYAFGHIDEAVEIILKKYNTQNRDRDALRFEADTLKKLAYDEDTSLGAIAKDRVERIAQVYQLLGFTSKPLKTADLIYTPKDNVRLQLTAEEQAWLEAHPIIRAINDKNYPPYDFYQNRKATGFSVEYLEKLAKMAGFKIQWDSRDEWNKAVSDFKYKKVDLLHAISMTEERKAFTLFTTPYFRNLTGLFVRENNQEFRTMADLATAKVAIPKGYADIERIKKSYPTSTIIETDGPREALKMVALGQANVTVLNSGVGNYLILEHGFSNLKNADYAFIGETGDEDAFFVGVRNDWPVLVSILNKAIGALDKAETHSLIRKWAIGGDDKKESLDTLSEEEQNWLKRHPVIRVHNEKDWPPFNYFEYGTPRGLSIDYMNLVAEKLGVKVEYVTGPSWNEFLEMVQRKELDVMLNIVKTEDRMKYLLYTDPYVKNPNVIVSSQDSPYENIKALFGKIVAFPKGFFYEEVLTKSFPQIKRLPVEDTLASLKAVTFGKADAALGEAAVVRTLINKNLLSGLSISGEVDIGDPDLANLRLGVRDDWPLLQSALLKAMAAITPPEMNQIRQKWLVIDKRQIDEKDISLAEASAGKATIPLSAAESTWLAEHQTIRFTGDPDWLPQEAFTSAGQYIGIVADILDILEARLGIRFERVPVKTWNEAVRLAEAAEVDILSETTSSGRDTMTFTAPYLVFPVVIIAKQGTAPISDPGELKSKRVAVVKDYGYVIPFRRQFPDLDYVVVETVRDGLMRLSGGEVDAFISAAPTAFHLMSELGLMNLNVIGSTGLSIDLGFGVRKDMPVLVSILNKGLAGITEEEKLKIRQKWVPAIDTSAPQTADPISYGRLFGYGIAVFLVLSLLAWLLIKLVKKEQIAVHFGSRWFRGLVLAGLSLFVLIVAFVGWYMLEHNKTEHLLNVDENLRGVISVSADRFDLWLKERISYLARLGRDPELVAITKRLLQVKPNKRALLASGALREGRFFFKNTEDIFGNIGFFLINPEHVSIGSMRDANLGTRNLISKQNPELLQRAFQGQVGFVPPMTSDVDLGSASKSDNAKKPPTMFFIGPVQDTDGRILAVMTLRVDPWKDFARALKSFENGASRESFAFDRNGVMLSSSRFEDQLRRIGLLAEDQSSALNIEIRDPGGNMVEGYRPGIERSQQSLTHMVSRTLTLRQQMASAGIRKGQSSVESNIEGYRDYRGVPVFGAWLWNADLDIGLAVEVDMAEALSHYYRTRLTIFSILGFTLVLSVGAILFVLIIGERTSRALMRARDNLEDIVAERTAELAEKQDLLRTAEERSRLLLNFAGEGIFGVDAEGRCTFANPTAMKLLGYSNEELIGQNIHKAIHHSHQDGSLYPVENCPMFKSFTEGATHRVADEVLWRKDGTHFPVEYASTPMEKDGRLVGAVITFGDITERKAAAERFSALLESAPDAMIVSDKTGNIVLVNSQAEVLFGYCREELIGKKIDMLVPEDIREVHPDYRAKFYADPKRLSMGFRSDFYGIAKDGRKIPMDIGLSPIETAEGLLVVASARDISERIEAETALRESEKRLQSILDTSPVGVAFSTKGKIHFANPRFEDMFGVGTGDSSPDLYVHPEERDVLVTKLTSGRKIEGYEIQLYNRDHDVRDFLITYLPIRFDDEEGILGWLLDITDRKNAEKEIKEKFDELTRFRRLAVGREKMMIELKKEINELAAQLGRGQMYKIVSKKDSLS